MSSVARWANAAKLDSRKPDNNLDRPQGAPTAYTRHVTTLSWISKVKKGKGFPYS